MELSRLNGEPLLPEIAQRLQDAIVAEQQKISHNVDILKTYPLVQVGVSYRF